MARRTTRTGCELTPGTAKRAEADRATAAIRDQLPAGLAQPALRALARAGYTTLDRLATVSEADLHALHGMGPKAVGIIQAALDTRNRSAKAGAARR